MALIKSHVLAALLVVAAAAAIGQAPRGVEGATTINATAVNTIISGIVPCSIGNSINPALTLAFPNASVQLVCASTVVANVTASSTGAFIFNLGTLANLITTLPLVPNQLLNGQCRVQVATPLVACNVSLAGTAGLLTAPVQVLSPSSGCVTGVVGGLVALVTGLFSTT